MGVAENLDLIRRGYAAFSAGDMETLSQLFAPDAVQIMPGNSAVSGTQKGPQEIIALYGELFARSNGTVRVELQDLLSNGSDQVVAVHRASAERNGNKIAQTEALLFTITGGKVAEIRGFMEDIDAQDAFWA
jgi:uncharacterized protein